MAAPLLHAIDADLAQAGRDLKAQAAGFHRDGARDRRQRSGGGDAKLTPARRARDNGGDGFRRGRGERRGLREAVERGDVFERDVVAPFKPMDVPLRRRRPPGPQPAMTVKPSSLR